MTVQIYAHRGASEMYAEHTRAAYLQALAEGADGVECDLHLTADGELVLIHDDEVSRTSNGSGAVAALTLAELRGLDFSSWHGASIPPSYGTTSTQLLTLPELLKILGGAGRTIGLAIEFKYGAVFDPVLIEATFKTLRRHGWSPENSTAGNVMISFMSFHPAAVKYLAVHVPAKHLCQLLELIDGQDAYANQELVSLMRAAMAEGEQLLDDGVAHLAGPGVEYLRTFPEKAARWLARGRTFRVWTIDTADDVQLCLSAGVRELTTNKPREIRSLLAAERRI